MQTSSNEIRLFKAYIETISSFNTGQDNFRNIKQAIIQCNVSKCLTFRISSDLRRQSKAYVQLCRGLDTTGPQNSLYIT